MRSYLAQVSEPIGNLSPGNVGIGSGDPVTTFASILSSAIGLLTIIAALYFMFTLITGAIQIIGSGGDKGAYEEARKKITLGVVGMIVVIAAMFIMDIVTDLLGIRNILDIGEQINNIRVP